MPPNMKRKTIPAIVVLLGIVGWRAEAQVSIGNFLGGAMRPPSPVVSPEEQQRQLLEKQKEFLPKDPWRFINGHTNFAKALGWKQFQGKILEVHPYGIRVQGSYGDPITWFQGGEGVTAHTAQREFFVEHFPYAAAENEWLGEDQKFVAFETGTFSYVSVLGDTRTIRSLDYGGPVEPPPGLVEAMAAKQQAAQAKAKADTLQAKQAAAGAALKWNQEQADKGDAFGQYRMGQRYLTGDGVEKDVIKAREMFAKSAAQGDVDASNALARLTGSK